MTVKDSVLEALQASRDDFLSGESLSATLDVSRCVESHQKTQRRGLSNRSGHKQRLYADERKLAHH